MDLREMEKKWQETWEERHIYEPKDSGGEKRFYTAAFPYPNSPQHIGHGRTYTLLDIHARYARLAGKNVLLPMAFHVTGTPILAMAKKVREKDPELLRIFRDIYGIPEGEFGELGDPEKLVMYFSREIEEGMREMGYSIDWRRKFYTFDAHFNKFVQWQMKKLHQMGYISKGSHRVAWCPSDKNVVSSHDTKGDVDPEIEEVTGVKFKLGEGEFLAVSTYRPETIYGVTNLWVNPESTLVKAETNEGLVYFGKEAWEALSLQLEGKALEEISGKELVGKEVETPLGKKVPVLPASFVDPGAGTGIVMSVPAHAPYDYAALKDLGKLDLLQDQHYVIGYQGGVVHKMEEEYKRYGIENQNDPKLDEMTKAVYKKEAHKGKMTIKSGEFRKDLGIEGIYGMPVMVAKEKVAEKLVSEGNAFRFYLIANGPVHCRCGAKITVNMVRDQWFIDYGNTEWKEKGKECLAEMKLIPENTRKDYLATIDWLKQKACTRSTGLGTPFPFDESKIVEPLSDSTIYMAFYTIAHGLEGMGPEELTEEFFDYVFLGRGDAGMHPKAKELRAKFEYWYPVDARHSGADLVRNHLPFFVLNHAAIFPEQDWPRGIIVNGFVLMEGKKMSKSLGNILPLRKAIREYGADVIRFSVVAGADLVQDTNFETGVAQGVKERVEHLLSLLGSSRGNDETRAGKWLLSRLNRKLREAPMLYSNMQARELGQMLFYESLQELQWYLKRAEKPGLDRFFEKWCIAFSPFMPHLAEEIWVSLGKEGLAVEQEFPEADESLVDDGLEIGEKLLSGIVYDVEKISERMGKKPSMIYVYVASGWKRGIYDEMKDKKDLRAGIEWAKANGAEMGSASGFAKSLMKKVHSLPPVLGEEDELEALQDAAEFLAKETGAEVLVRKEDDASGGHEKASAAAPGKPALILE
ncbi:leucine--tRNA ligase [Candidatus Micrarchaeota archaeon]|nr:leucine--tRNA ligase [Candidatus Micrarchaeota archaeon]MBD3418205.1 leucine--tRNA ligase [Candidatus Micrarchaeota archaeon]